MPKPVDDVTWRGLAPVEPPPAAYSLAHKMAQPLDGQPCCVMRAMCPRLAEQMAEVLDEDTNGQGELLWHHSRQAAESVTFSRPAHDQWEIRSLVLVTCDDFMKRVFHTPYWHQPALCPLTPLVLQLLEVLLPRPWQRQRCNVVAGVKCAPSAIDPVSLCLDATRCEYTDTPRQRALGAPFA